MATSLPTSIDWLPPIDQVGYVVRDLDKALKIYDPFFGPFTIIDSPLQGARFRGEHHDVHLRVAIGHSGGVEIEFIECLSGQSPHSEFIAKGCEGPHHIRFSVEDVEETCRRLAEHGYQPIWEMQIPHVAEFAYLEHESQEGVILELLHLHKKSGS